jgi:hypothetical protein
MLKLFILPKLSLPHLPMLTPYYGENFGQSILFQKIPANEYKGIFETANFSHESDYLLIPHNWSHIKNNFDYIRDCERESERLEKKIIVFEYSDSHDPVTVKNAIVFRSSQYRSLLGKNEIIMPAYVEDLGRNGIITRHKSNKPVVGFVGRSGFLNLGDRLKFAFKSIIRKGAFRDGRYFRRKMMNACTKSNLVVSNFIERKSYSGNLKSIELDPLVARKEYVDNMNQSDFVLAPKGDGNYSLRFYEALSLGRVPVMIDTEALMPFSDILDYAQFSLLINMEDAAITDKRIADFYGTLSAGQFEEMQKKARDIFIDYLSMPSFLKKALTKEYLNRYEK